MTFITTIPADTADAEVQAMYQRQRSSWGYLPNYARLFSHRPELMARWASLLSGIRRPVGDRRFEIVTLAAALALRSSYCSLAHGRALGAHLTTADVIAIAEAREDEVLPADEVAMVRFARRIAREPSVVSRDEVDELRRHGLGDDEIFDLVAVVAARAFFTTLLEGLGAQADAEYRALDPALRDALTVGRPIAEL
jgi:uncharacterized peroxidase-related enzyme